MRLLQKQLDNVILPVGTNDASSGNSSEIVKNIILSKPNMRSDTAAGKVTIEEDKKQLSDFDFDMDNSNLSRAYLNGRGLHLHTKGMLQFAKNITEGIRKS